MRENELSRAQEEITETRIATGWQRRERREARLPKGKEEFFLQRLDIQGSD